MFCHKCGSQNPDNAVMCGACGASFANPYESPTSELNPPTQINNYLVPAIFSALCCCPPFGIVSIVYAAQVNGLLAGGNVAGAMKAAQSAKMWFWIALGLGLTANGLYFGAMVISILAGANNPGMR